MADYFTHKSKRVYLLDGKRENALEALITLRKWTYELEAALENEYNKTTEWEDFLLRLALITHPLGSFDEPEACPSEWITELLLLIDKWTYIHDGTNRQDAIEDFEFYHKNKDVE